MNKSVAGDGQQLPALLIMKCSGAVGKLHATRKSSQTCRQEAVIIRFHSDLCASAETVNTRLDHLTAERETKQTTSSEVMSQRQV